MFAIFASRRLAGRLRGSSRMLHWFPAFRFRASEIFATSRRKAGKLAPFWSPRCCFPILPSFPPTSPRHSALFFFLSFSPSCCSFPHSLKHILPFPSFYFISLSFPRSGEEQSPWKTFISRVPFFPHSFLPYARRSFLFIFVASAFFRTHTARRLISTSSFSPRFRPHAAIFHLLP